MPRKRQIKEPCDCLDCREVFPSDALIGTAVALQQPPPKCLILYLPSCLEISVAEEHLPDLPHVNRVVQQGSSGLLALRTEDGSPLPGPSDVLKNLFGTVPICKQPEGKGAEERGASLRHMAADLCTPSTDAACIGEQAGFSNIYSPEEILSGSDGCLATSPDLLAAQISQKLGLEELRRRCLSEAQTDSNPEQEDSGTDLLFMCIDPESRSCGVTSDKSREAQEGLRLWPADLSAAELDQNCNSDLPSAGESRLRASDPERLLSVDRLLKELSGVPGFHDSVLLVILLGIHAATGTDLSIISQTITLQDLGVRGYAGVARPRQSFQSAALDEVNIDKSQALLCLQRLPYVIRVDEEQSLPRTLDTFRPGNRCILAERLLPEIAYKLRCAPKYGA